MMAAKRTCKHRSYPTAMAAQNAAARVFDRRRRKDVERCPVCQKWRLKEGLV